jgi:hypothetical protein
MNPTRDPRLAEATTAAIIVGLAILDICRATAFTNDPEQGARKARRTFPLVGAARAAL